MKKLRYIFILSLLLSAACSVTGSLRRQGTNARVLHTPKPLQASRAAHAPEYVEIEHEHDPLGYLIPTTRLENGEQIMTMDMAPVTVVSRSRMLPERKGIVTIDFIIALPRGLQGKCRSIVVTPVLHNDSQRTPLQEITLRGAFFDKIMTRDYWQYERYLQTAKPDSLRAACAFRRFVRFPAPEGMRLDSVFEHSADVSYRYTQDVPTVKAGKQLRITLEGYVTGLDGSIYRLPHGDTLFYNISSVGMLADTATRYMTRIVEKYVEVQDRNYLSFPTDDSRIVDTLGDNRSQLARIENLMNRIVSQQEFIIDSIVLTASSSPEGSYPHNARLARERAQTLARYLSRRFNGLDTVLRVRSIPEQWDELADMIRADSSIRQRDRILALWQQVANPDAREMELRRRFPAQYRYIRRHIYPSLRAVMFRYALRRKGMVKDTVHTTQPDTLYARGVRLLQSRRYDEALYILSAYNDRNTAVTLLSMGYDRRALEILQALPSDAVAEYLRAIAFERLGEPMRALRHYREACRLDPDLEYRGDLDPEISNLKKIADEKKM